MSSSTRSTRRWRRTKNLAQLFVQMSQGTIFGSIPLVLILLVTCLDFISFEYALHDTSGLFSLRSVEKIDGELARLRADALQKNVQTVAYVMAILFALPHLNSLVRFFIRERVFSLIILTILLTSTVSDNATKVYTNAIHISFGMIAAFLYTNPIRHRRDIITRVLWVVFFSSGLVLLVSLLNWTASLGENLERFSDGWRYGGFVGNPNNMGWVCMIACWSGLGLAINREVKRGLRFFALFGVFMAFACAILADSTTTFVVLAVIVAFSLWNYFITSFSSRMQTALKAVCIAAVLIATPLLVVYLLGPSSVIATASESLTGDATLTGRSEIWEVGQAAIIERPLLGWSFDTHLTVSESRYSIPYTQYHNGYIDTLVSGGITLLLVLLWQVVATTWRTLRIAQQDVLVFPVFSFLGIVFVANISEYAILRIDNPIWQTYVVCAIAVASIHFSSQEKPKRAKAPKRISASKRRTKSYRF